MACCSEPGGCGGDRPFPWFSALRDPAMRRLFLVRFRRELLLGLGAGCLTGTVALAAGEGLVGGLGTLVGGPWLHFHAAAVLPAALLGGVVLALTLSGGVAGHWGPASCRVLACALLGGAANGFLELGDAGGSAFFQGGGLVSLLGFGLLGLPALWLAWAGLAWAFRGVGRRPCA